MTVDVTPPLSSAFVGGRNLAGRLTRAALESSGIALVVAGLAINLLVYGASLGDLQREAATHARMAGDSSSAALLFGDAKAAGETLAFLRGWPEVERATIVDAHGQVFATYRSPEVARRSQAELDAARVLTVSEPILESGQPIGRIYMSVSLQPLQHQTWMLASVTVLSALLGLTFAFLRVSRLRRAVGRAEAELDRLAFFDPVSGLYNRHAAQAYLGQAVANTSEPFAVALLDLDDFKLVNDTLGHSAGDELLRGLGERLRLEFGSGGVVFRLGGDEFIVVCPGIVDDAALKRLGRRMVDALSESLATAGKVMSVRGSIGIAAFPAHGVTAQELLRAADMAMYQAKASGKNTHALFDEAMAEASAAHLQLCTEFRLALEHQELELHYQPIVELASGALIGTEALVRWRHPEHGLLAAGQFIGAAEASGLVVPLGGWVLEAAARQQAEWARSGLGHLFIAVNASAQQFKRNVLLEQVHAALAATGADPKRLQIELTEHTLVEDVSSNVQTLASLRSLGIKIAIDDFGTGLSSLAYLKRLPIDKLKIDRSFVEDMTAGDEDTAIVATIVSLSQALHLEVVAEGIETVHQRDLLRRLGAQHGQGYLFSKAVPAAQIPGLVALGAARGTTGGRPHPVPTAAR